MHQPRRRKGTIVWAEVAGAPGVKIRHHVASDITFVSVLIHTLDVKADKSDDRTETSRGIRDVRLTGII